MSRLSNLSALALLLFVSCSFIQSDVERVKKTPCNNLQPALLFGDVYDTGTVEEWMNMIAGMRGEVQWKSFRLPNEPSNIVCVEAQLKADPGKEYTKARVQFLHNRKTGMTECTYAEKDGEAISLIVLGLMAI